MSSGPSCLFRADERRALDQDQQEGEEGKHEGVGAGTGGVEICIISNNAQALDQAQLLSLGCDPTQKRAIFLKSAHHFRAHFGPLSDRIETVDGGGLGSVIVKGGGAGFSHVRRPVWPLDKDVTMTLPSYSTWAWEGQP